MTHMLHLGDCRTVLSTLNDNSVDSIVCDPPYELNFMGRVWDNSGIAYDVTVWQQCLRVLKPGGHLVAFGGSRTYHRLAVAIEDAGFEIRDQIQWIYGSGFPKSHNVANAIDKSQGHGNRGHAIASGSKFHQTTGLPRANGELLDKYVAKTDIAKPYEGWGTALKPAHEPAVLARKPLCGTVADNVTAWGVGALNIDGTRIATDNNLNGGSYGKTSRDDDQFFNGKKPGGAGVFVQPIGRWPANVIFDEEAAQILDGQSGMSKSTGGRIGKKQQGVVAYGGSGLYQSGDPGYGDIGGASRFFYTAKASKAEREAGLDGMEQRQVAGKGNGLARTCEMCGANTLNGCECENRTYSNPTRLNHHPTVKPLALMRYLVRLVTPKDGIVLDPFMGSGSTGCASVLEGFNFIGIDIESDYVEIAQKRIAHHANIQMQQSFNLD